MLIFLEHSRTRINARATFHVELVCAAVDEVSTHKLFLASYIAVVSAFFCARWQKDITAFAIRDLYRRILLVY